ncbi:MAG: isoprenoid biosynthesis glyoxalase ElbB [Planctomycetota bacterium]
MANVLVVLSGCGVQDGSEIHEAVSTLIHLDRNNCSITMAAPDVPQRKVHNHAAGEDVSSETRNVLAESARIARGDIKSLTEVKGSDFDAIIFPGGFGAALNLCDFALKGADCEVNPDVRRVLVEARQAEKVIGLICIAPALGAAVLGADYHPSVTIGNDAGTAEQINKTGAKHVDTEPTGICIDESNKVVSTGAYMCNTRPAPVYEGIGKLVDQVLKMVG